MPRQNRQAVLVLGMHRGGTSAVAGICVHLGLSPPRTPLPEADDNPTGFFEPMPAVMINHNILLAAGCAWNLCLTFEPAQLQTVPDDVRRQIASVLESEFADGPGLGLPGFVLKDPRLCLTAPAWLDALSRAGHQVSALIVVRHPAEVVASLLRRNGLPEEETAPHWLHHMLEAERATRRFRRAVIFYDDLVADWRRCIAQATEASGIVWPKPIAEAAESIDRFLSRPAGGHGAGQLTASVGPAPVNQMVDAVWTALRRLSDDPESPFPLVCLDTVRPKFAEWRYETVPPGLQAGLPPAVPEDVFIARR